MGENVCEMRGGRLQLENQKTAIIKDALALCEQHADFVSRQLLVKLKDGSEEYIDWLETQQELITVMGIQNYTQSLLDD